MCWKGQHHHRWQGHSLKGVNTTDAVNIVATNVTVKNIHITNWGDGILCTYNSDITNNIIVKCAYGIKIYSNYNLIIQNTFTNVSEGVRLSGVNNFYLK